MIKCIIIRLTHANVWKSMGKPFSCTQFIKPYFFLLKVTCQYYKSRENSYQVLQVTQEFVSGTTSHVRASECAKKSCDKIIITIVPSCTGKVSHVCCRWHCYSCCTHVDNTDGNKLGIISGIALYCGSTYISLAFVFAKLDYGKSKNTTVRLPHTFK